jgi:hypothetical protein
MGGDAVRFIAIIGLSVFAAILYGIVHDQVTARICVEYFTIGHPPIFGTEDPTRLALGWGVLATWWAGLLLGVPLAVAARVGPWPPRSPGSLIRPIAVLMSVMAGGALLAGIAGWFLANAGVVFLVGAIAEEVPADKHVRFLADLWAHSASYLVGFVGGFIAIFHIWRSRVRSARGGSPEPP